MVPGPFTLACVVLGEYCDVVCIIERPRFVRSCRVWIIEYTYSTLLTMHFILLFLQPAMMESTWPPRSLDRTATHSFHRPTASKASTLPIPIDLSEVIYCLVCPRITVRLCVSPVLQLLTVSSVLIGVIGGTGLYHLDNLTHM